MIDRRPSAPRVRFGCFEADLRKGELRKQGLQIKLQEKPFQMLAVLLEHAGELVTREEMRQRLWPADTFVDFDANLDTALNKLRQALGDSAENSRFVQTIPRRGYCFIAPVTLIDESADVLIPALDPVTTRMLKEGTSFPRVTILVTPFENLPRRHTLTVGNPVNPGAYDDYLKGLFEFNRRTQEGLQRSIKYFRQASEKDPEFAPTYAALAYSYVVAASWTFLSPKEAYPRAKEAAQKALTIDDTLSDAHFIVADVLHEYDWDWSGAEGEYLRGLELNPSSPVGHRYYAEYLTHAGRYPEALAEIRKAQQLDPLSLITHSLLCFVNYHAREYDTAIAECKKVLELDPNFFPAHYFLGEAYSGKRFYAQAVSEHQKACDISGNVSMMSAAIACNYVTSGHVQEGRKILEELLWDVKQTYVSPYALAKIYASLGDKELALAMLEKAFEQRSFELVYLNDEPQFGVLHETPRFRQMLAQRGFPSSATALASST